MRFVSDTDSFGKDTEGGCHVQLILASFFFFWHILAFILPKDMKKLRNIDKPVGFRLSKLKKKRAFGCVYCWVANLGPQRLYLQMRGEILWGLLLLYSGPWSSFVSSSVQSLLSGSSV